MNPEQNAQAAGGAEEGAALAPEIDQLAAAPPPTKKETSLREFLGKMDDYAPIVCCPGRASCVPCGCR
jgi:transcription initiation factor TFIID subunit 10